MQFHSESEFVFAGKSNGLDSWVLSEMTSLLFVYVDAILLLSTSDFASEFHVKTGFAGFDNPDSGSRTE